MEKSGADRRKSEELEVDGGGNLITDFPNVDAGVGVVNPNQGFGNVDAGDSEENDTFEEAMDTEGFQHRHQQSDSQDFLDSIASEVNEELNRVEESQNPAQVSCSQSESNGMEKLDDQDEIVDCCSFSDRSSVEEAEFETDRVHKYAQVKSSANCMEGQTTESELIASQGVLQANDVILIEVKGDSPAKILGAGANDSCDFDGKLGDPKESSGELHEEANGEVFPHTDSVSVQTHLENGDGVMEAKGILSALLVGEDRNSKDTGQDIVEGDTQGIENVRPDSNGCAECNSGAESNPSTQVVSNGKAYHDKKFIEQISHDSHGENFSPQSYDSMVNGMKADGLAQMVSGAASAYSHAPKRSEVESTPTFMENSNKSISSGDAKTLDTSSAPHVATTHPGKSDVPSLPSRPAGLGTSPLLKATPRSLQQPRANGSLSQRQPQSLEEPISDEPEENTETREKLQMIRVKFLRLAHRLGQTPHNVVVAQVLYRLGLAEQLWGNTNRAGVFSYDQASVMAEQLEAMGQEHLDFSCTIMAIGKSGVGKSATINSVLDEAKFSTNAFQLGTKKVQAIEGTVQGIKVKVIDTPGLSSSSADQHRNWNVLQSVKKFIKKTPPDIVLYFDRLDMPSRDFGDVPLLRTITGVFGPSIWLNAIVVLTHAASAPPEGLNGNPLSYEMFVTQRSHVVQQAIRQAAGDTRIMNPISLVENHSACRINRAGQRVLPNGQIWKPQLLLLSFATKILAEANMLLKLQDNPSGSLYGSRTRVPPLPFLLSTLLQSRPELKLPDEQIGIDDAMDEDLQDASDSDNESEDYDNLPPFKSLTKSQLAKLSRVQRKAYFEELEYREKLFLKKQLKEERKRRKLLKKNVETMKDLVDNNNAEDDSSGPASVPVPMPDMALPNSFDSDYPSHRYRFLDSSSHWLVRPVLETHGWDHDIGYEGLNVERLFVVKNKVPVSASGQFIKDKKDCNLQMELGTLLKHGEKNATSLGLDIQTVEKDLAYTFRGETRFRNFRINNTSAALSATLLGDSLSTGMKIENKLNLNKWFRLLMSGGVMTGRGDVHVGRGDVAYGGRLEATLRDKDYPFGHAISTLALSIVDWHGDLALGWNVQSQIPLGRNCNLTGRANVSNKGSGQVGIRLNTSEHLEIGLLALFPILRNAQRILFGSSHSM